MRRSCSHRRPDEGLVCTLPAEWRRHRRRLVQKGRRVGHDHLAHGPQLAKTTVTRCLSSASGAGVEQDGTTPTTTMQKATNWSQVGEWVALFDPTAADGSTKLKPNLSTNNGTAAATPITLTTPEALAWYGYKLNTNPTEITSGSTTYANAYVKLDAPSGTIDLTGETLRRLAQHRCRHPRGAAPRRAEVGAYKCTRQLLLRHVHGYGDHDRAPLHFAKS